MRRTLLALASAILLAGCASPPAKPPPTAVTPTVMLEITVVDDEIVPIPGATIVVFPGPHAANADERGKAMFRLRPGPYALNVSATKFLSDQSTVEVGPMIGTQEMQTHQIILQPTPSDFYLRHFAFRKFVCGVAAWVRPVDVECQQSANVMIPPYATFATPKGLGPGPIGTWINITWTPHAGSERIRFQLRPDPTRPFADGRENIELEGPSPVRFQVPPTLVDEAFRANGVLRVTAFASSGDVSVLQGQYIEATGEFITFHHAGEDV